MSLKQKLIITTVVASVSGLVFGLFFLLSNSYSNKTMAASLVGTALTESFETGNSNWIGSGTGIWSLNTNTTYKRNGIQSVKLNTSLTTDGRYYASSYTKTIPSVGVYYVTLIVHVHADNVNNEASVGLHAMKGNTDVKASKVYTASTASGFNGWTMVSYTFPVTNGETFYPYFTGRSTVSGAAVNLYYDDMVMYASTLSTLDQTIPSIPSIVNVKQNAGSLSFNWTPGTDNIGLEGAMVLRYTGITTSYPGISYQAAYSNAPIGAQGPDKNWTVVYSGANTSACTDNSGGTGNYTYLVYMRDEAYNYSSFARVFVMNNIVSTAYSLPSGSLTLDGLYLAAGNTLNVSSGAPLTLKNGNVYGKIVNWDVITYPTQPGNVEIDSGGTYEHRTSAIGNGIPRFKWIKGSNLQITNIDNTTAGLSQNFYNITWNASAQTTDVSLKRMTVSGNFNLYNCGTGKLLVDSTISFAGNILQTGGTLNFQSGSSFLLNGASLQSFSFNSGTVAGTVSVTLDNAAGVSMINNLNLNGTLSLNKGAMAFAVSKSLSINKGAKIIRAGGSLSGTVYYSGLYDLHYTAASTTGVELPASSSMIGNLNVNIKDGGAVALSANTTFSGNMNFTSGTFNLGNYNFTLGTTGTISGANSSSFFVTNGTGFLKQSNIGLNGATTAVWFPVGSSATSYTPASVKNAGKADIFRVRILNNVYADYKSDGTPVSVSSMAKKVVNRTWLIEEEVAGGSNATITLQWNPGEEDKPFKRSSCSISHYTGGKWKCSPATAACGTTCYTQSVSDITSFSPFTVSNEMASLPVELTTFKAIKESYGARLKWATASELNNSHFDVEKSSNASNWEKVGEVQGNGTTQMEQNYEYMDNALSFDQEIIYYRLKQVDYNGNFEYSPIRKIESGNASLENKDFKAWFNANNDKFSVQASNDGSVTVQAVLMNISGQMIEQKSILGGKDEVRFEFDATALPDGIYIISMQRGGTSESMKIMKRR